MVRLTKIVHKQGAKCIGAAAPFYRNPDYKLGALKKIGGVWELEIFKRGAKKC